MIAVKKTMVAVKKTMVAVKKTMVAVKKIIVAVKKTIVAVKKTMVADETIIVAAGRIVTTAGKKDLAGVKTTLADAKTEPAGGKTGIAANKTELAGAKTAVAGGKTILTVAKRELESGSTVCAGASIMMASMKTGLESGNFVVTGAKGFADFPGFRLHFWLKNTFLKPDMCTSKYSGLKVHSLGWVAIILQTIIFTMKLRGGFFLLCFLSTLPTLMAQPGNGTHWSADGNSFYEANEGAIVQTMLPNFTQKTIVTAQQMMPAGSGTALPVDNFAFSGDGKQVLIYTNSQRVWRYKTRGDYWVLNTGTGSLKQLGKGLPGASLMFAKFSPDGMKAGYVSGHNLYVEDLGSGVITKLTQDGTDRMINGTFDWVYEEELDCRDGFRWSPDGKSLAYWKIDATKIRNFLMIDNTDSIYSFTVPVEYPKVGEDPSPCYLYVVTVASGNSVKMNVPGDAQQHYIPRMEWANNNNELVIEQLNRRQNESRIMYCNVTDGSVRDVYDEKADSAWIDVKAEPIGWNWLQNGNAFLWTSEKDGWRHVYAVSRDGKKETLLTKGNYDVISTQGYNEKNGYLYFAASPENATQSYLYRVKLDGKEKAERVSPVDESGTHEYEISPNGMYASHSFSNANTAPVEDWVSLPGHKTIKSEKAGNRTFTLPPVNFFTVTTEDNVTMDGWMVKPKNFDSTKKYPVVFTVYTEPAAQTVTDSYGTGYNWLYNGSMYDDGYIYISLDGRGTPAPKGSAWRKAIYKNIGIVNIRDQAMAAKKLLQQNAWMDTSRVAVWGWSGGGSTTLNLLFQYPEIYKTGIAIAPVAWQLCYDNIYQERYMGLPQEDKTPFIKGSPVTYAKNLQGHLLVVHGTGDDNVHYQNTELLVNELIKYNKDFRMMSYPNRTHAIREGEGTSEHLRTIYTNYLRENCAPGGR